MSLLSYYYSSIRAIQDFFEPPPPKPKELSECEYNAAQLEAMAHGILHQLREWTAEAQNPTSSDEVRRIASDRIPKLQASYDQVSLFVNPLLRAY